jgi:PP-loop superfamily ATP-utilizing enzyme
MDWKDKLEKIRTNLAWKDKILVAFSGGLDRSLLAKIFIMLHWIWWDLEALA